MTTKKISAVEFETAWKNEKAFYENELKTDRVIFILKGSDKEMVVCDDYSFDEKKQLIAFFRKNSHIATLKVSKLNLTYLHFQ